MQADEEVEEELLLAPGAELDLARPGGRSRTELDVTDDGTHRDADLVVGDGVDLQEERLLVDEPLVGALSASSTVASVSVTSTSVHSDQGASGSTAVLGLASPGACAFELLRTTPHLPCDLLTRSSVAGQIGT